MAHYFEFDVAPQEIQPRISRHFFIRITEALCTWLEDWKPDTFNLPATKAESNR